ncbi:hypothetical protein [Aquimarina algiphila]|uniref:hypothetical protein n=1 Tax=Aquimarina algiphila TaxID=2047982 RepID=UPI00232D1D96|nr:hypothetical protein [Aquimarina algiphila]
MRKNILIFALLSLNLASAQLNLDFEAILTQNITSNTPKLVAYIDDNPVTDGINPSKNAIKVIEFAECQYWGSTIVNKFGQTISFDEGRFFSIDFFSPRPKGMITLKFQKGVEKDFIYSGKANTWRTAIFNFSDTPKSTTSVKIDIFFDVRDHTKPSKNYSDNLSEEVYWFDNVVQSKRRIRRKR